MTRAALLLPFLAVILGSCAPATNVKKVSAEEAKRMIDKGVYLLDVRTPREFARGYIEGARLFPLQHLEEKIGQLDAKKEEPILIYCRSGRRTGLAAPILAKHGYLKIYDLDRGLRSWMAKGYPLKRK